MSLFNWEAVEPMKAKKAIARMSTGGRAPKIVMEIDGAPKVVKKVVQKRAVVAAHPRYAEMAVVAIRELKERKGSSRHAIINYLLAHYPVAHDPKKVNALLKPALRKCVESGVLKSSLGVPSMSGRFRLGDKAIAAAKKKVKADEKHIAKVDKEKKKTSTNKTATKKEGDKKATDSKSKKTRPSKKKSTPMKKTATLVKVAKETKKKVSVGKSDTKAKAKKTAQK